MLLVDTNIFLEVLLAQQRKDDCAAFLQRLVKGKEVGIVTDFSIHSIIVIMGNLDKLEELRIFLLSLTAYKGLKIYNTTLSDEVKATQIAQIKNLDMDDALQYSAAQALNAQAIVSLDKHFNNLEIPRKNPA
jgi:predicted nucleic acid-binding protein